MIDVMNSSNPLDNSISCPVEHSEYISEEFWLIAVFGGLIGLIGIGCNIALLQVLFQKELRTTYLIYLAALAIMDIGIIITFLLLMVVSNLYEYFQSYTLFVIWHGYVRYFYTISRIVTLASTYLVLVCTLERYWEVTHLMSFRNNVKMTQIKRYIIVGCVILGSVLFRGVVFLEVTVDVRPECKGTMGYLALNRTELVKDYVYSKIYSFWLVHIAQVFFPFPALVFLNVVIALTWHRVIVSGRRASTEVKRLAQKSQSARKMMVAIVTSYLVCNTLHLILTIWEHVDMDYLKQHGDFYAFASNAVTLLTAISATSRLPIYYASNGTIRAAIQNLWFAKHFGQVLEKSRVSMYVRRRRSGKASRCRRSDQMGREDENYLVTNNGTSPSPIEVNIQGDEVEKDGEMRLLNQYASYV